MSMSTPVGRSGPPGTWGRLYLHEQGRVLRGQNEELSRWRWVRKEIVLQPSAQLQPESATLWLMVGLYRHDAPVLQVFFNGRELDPICPGDQPGATWAWRSLDIPAWLIRSGANIVELRAENPAMNGWMLAVEPGHRDPHSAVSLDRGRTWTTEAMGACGVLRGEYLVRLRVRGGGITPHEPPPVTYEDQDHPRVRELVELVPAAIRHTADPWHQILALRTWVARQWTHDPFGRSYTPWDPWTVLDWVKRDWCHGQAGRVAFCVHFGVVFTSLAAALGHRARAVAVTREVNSADGHFMAEVWDAGRGRWVLHDPNYDVHYERVQPLSLVELSDLARTGHRFNDWVCAGEGLPREIPRLMGMFESHFAGGLSFAHASVWSDNRFVSLPSVSPPGHGTLPYCETAFVWYQPDREPAMGMFPWLCPDRDWFLAPPPPRRAEPCEESGVATRQWNRRSTTRSDASTLSGSEID